MTDNSDTTRLSRLVVQRPLLIVLAVSIPLVEYLARESGGPAPSIAIVRNPFAAIAAGTVFCRYLLCNSLKLSRNWTVYAMPVAIAIGLASAPRGAPVQVPTMHAMVAVGWLGALGFIVAAVRASDPRDKATHVRQLLDALLLPLAASMVSFGLWSTSFVNPVYDARVYAFEELLGVRLSLLGVRSFLWLAPFALVAAAAYGLVGLGVVLVAAAQKTARRETDILNAAVVAGICGFVLYFICPVVGPLAIFPSTYPSFLPPVPAGVPLMIAPFAAPRNAMPSLHTVWALLIWFNADTLSTRARRSARLFAVMNLWAAIGVVGAHWFMDMVVAVPLAVAIQSAVIGDQYGERRWTTAMASGVLTVVWLIGFRAADPLLSLPKIAAWIAVLVTICWPLRRWLIERSDPNPFSARQRGRFRIRKSMSGTVPVPAEH
jgi:hypothetical protein